MVKRVPILGFLVAFTVLAGGFDAWPAHAQPAPAQPSEIRIVAVRAVADEMYRAQPGWDAMLRRTIQAVSDIYERQFQIRLVVRDVVPWTIGQAVPIPRILARVRAEVSTGPADVLVVFAAERCEKLEYGFAQTFGRYAMVQTGCLASCSCGRAGSRTRSASWTPPSVSISGKSRRGPSSGSCCSSSGGRRKRSSSFATSCGSSGAPPARSSGSA